MTGLEWWVLAGVAVGLACQAVESWWRYRVLRRARLRMVCAPFGTRPPLELRAFEE